MATGNTAVKVAGIAAATLVLGPVILIGSLLAVAYLAWRQVPKGELDELQVNPDALSMLLGGSKTKSENCEPVSAGYDKDPSKGPVVLPGAVYDGPELARAQDKEAAQRLGLVELDTGTLWPPTLKTIWTNLNSALAQAGITGTQIQLWYQRAVKRGEYCLPGTIVAWSETARVSNLAASNPSTNKFEYERQVRLARNRIRSYRAALILWDEAGRPELPT